MRIWYKSLIWEFNMRTWYRNSIWGFNMKVWYNLGVYMSEIHNTRNEILFEFSVLSHLSSVVAQTSYVGREFGLIYRYLVCIANLIFWIFECEDFSICIVNRSKRLPPCPCLQRKCFVRWCPLLRVLRLICWMRWTITRIMKPAFNYTCDLIWDETMAPMLQRW